ncbi:biotin transporter BioY [Salinibacterium sp. PAMC 21357]|uniref:biotin transporter BioY n=1 Tax=Salinibacterium sp. PAMC 21357 TaxID=1112215 RepID=UPI000288BC70|nr:biotin transporter BioY [Salinibacterium sp. PAMC 21357]
MSDTTLGLRPTIVDRIFGQNIASSVTFVVAGAALTAIAAQFVVPLYPVPVTAQTLAVLVVGMALGALRGALAMILYATLGVMGFPVFSNLGSGLEVLTGPSGGYIAGFVVSAALVGFLAEKKWDRSFALATAATSLGTAVTFLFGLAGLSFALERMESENRITNLLAAGFTPFLLGATIKILLASAIFALSWRAILRKAAREPALQ